MESLSFSPSPPLSPSRWCGYRDQELEVTGLEEKQEGESRMVKRHVYPVVSLCTSIRIELSVAISRSGRFSLERNATMETASEDSNRGPNRPF